MAISFTKRMIIFAAVALIGGAGAYVAGSSGVDPGQAILEARCSAGAFIKHAPAPGQLVADAGAQTAEAQTTLAEHDAGTTSLQAAPPVGANLFTNSTLEAVGQTAPQEWTTAKYGDNDAAFSQVAGHNSNRAVRIDITKYANGNASWANNTVTIKPSGYYEFTDFYRSNVAAPVVVMFKTTDGKQSWQAVGQSPASMSWTQYTTRFFVPANVNQIIATHTLDRLGSLETDDYVLTESTPTGFQEPLVSVTFDDGYTSQHAAALPVMKKYSVVSTQYIVSGFLGTKGYETAGQLYDFTKAGHEVAAHTFDHRDLTRLDDKDLARELDLPKTGLSKCFADTSDFAAPFGAFDIRTTTQIKGRYATARSTSAGFNSADFFNPYELKVQNVLGDTTPAQLQAWLDTAKQTHTWLILVYHQVDQGGGEYARKPADFDADMKAISGSGIAVKTVHDAYAAVQPQLKQ
jgi:peptidoglycan/xylan/chitin deacetylase (PgdA/CDA1 family)